MIKKIILILFIIFQSCYLFSQEDWKLVKNSDDIKIYTKKEVTYKFETFKATVIINSSIHNFIAVLNNVEILPKWGHKVKFANMLEKYGDTLQIYYSVAKTPFPYKNRDGIYLTRSKWITDEKTLHVDIEILDDYLALDEKYVRLKGFGYWKINVISDNRLDITFSMQINPGGSIPSWLANMFNDDAPYYTLLNLKKLMEKEDFVKYKYDFID